MWVLKDGKLVLAHSITDTNVHIPTINKKKYQYNLELQLFKHHNIFSCLSGCS